MSMPLETARAIIRGAREAGRTQGWKPLTIVVLDSAASVVAAEREDGASIGRFQIAFGKAHGALAMGVGSRALMARAEQQPFFISAVAAATGGAMIPVPGGVLIRSSEGELLGAVGVTGDTSDNDEAAAVAGVEAAGLLAQLD
jgi:uncharacterized protein GlcG (DUF336 family)